MPLLGICDTFIRHFSKQGTTEHGWVISIQSGELLGSFSDSSHKLVMFYGGIFGNLVQNG